MIFSRDSRLAWLEFGVTNQGSENELQIWTLASSGRAPCDMIKEFKHHIVDDEKSLEDIFLLEDS